MIRPECILSGDNFDPADLIKKIPDVRIEKIIATGEIGTRGRYKGQLTPYGLCKITTPDSIPVEEKIKWLTAIISRHIETFRANGATDIEFSIYWTGLQGNMEFTSEQLRGIADLGIPLTIDYVFEKSED
jgi:hypothetical protein